MMRCRRWVMTSPDRRQPDHAGCARAARTRGCHARAAPAAAP
ncbi:hypothetical protein HMPREF0185_01183, partial [Brevundimonas diminuta 470-4]